MDWWLDGIRYVRIYIGILYVYFGDITAAMGWKSLPDRMLENCGEICQNTMDLFHLRMVNPFKELLGKASGGSLNDLTWVPVCFHFPWCFRIMFSNVSDHDHGNRQALWKMWAYEKPGCFPMYSFLHSHNHHRWSSGTKLMPTWPAREVS